MVEVAAAHPDIVSLFTVGTSFKGRPLWAAKVSDNVMADEDEPEVLFDGLHDGNEHMSLEMTLAILDWLVDGYGSDPRVTGLVNSRETWIVFALNPDGAAYDVLPDGFRDKRKNRQPNADGTVGTDLNRNYDYRWGWAGTSGSPDPGSSNYRGPRPFSAPETRAMRDFLASRVVGGRQQVRVAITFHEYGRQVMWPYAYTRADVPLDMTTDDAAGLRRIGRRMAASSGYTPLQGERRPPRLRHVPRLRLRAVPDLRLHRRAVGSELSQGHPHRGRDRAQPGGRAVPHGAGVVPAQRAGRRRGSRPVRRLR